MIFDSNKNNINDGNYVETLRNGLHTHTKNEESDSFSFTIDIQAMYSNKSRNTFYEQEDEIIKYVTIGSDTCYFC